MKISMYMAIIRLMNLPEKRRYGFIVNVPLCGVLRQTMSCKSTYHVVLESRLFVNFVKKNKDYVVCNVKYIIGSKIKFERT